MRLEAGWAGLVLSEDRLCALVLLGLTARRYVCASSDAAGVLASACLKSLDTALRTRYFLQQRAKRTRTQLRKANQTKSNLIIRERHERDGQNSRERTYYVSF